MNLSNDMKEMAKELGEAMGELKQAVTAFTYPIENNFTYHAPTADQVAKYADLRDKAKEFAYLIQKLCPGSPEATLAMRKLEESVMWANSAIARNP